MGRCAVQREAGGRSKGLCVQLGCTVSLMGELPGVFKQVCMLERTFQLLCGIRDSQARGIETDGVAPVRYHGGLKCPPQSP